MVMKPEPLASAIEDVRRKVGSTSSQTVLLSPQGRLFDQGVAEEFSKRTNLILVCGRYEGIDERIVEHWIEDEVSIGDYVLSGGEIPAMVVVDSVTRLIPGAVGCEESIERESFTGGLLDYPQYTRPAEYNGLRVPEVLLSGNHAEIEAWRLSKAIEKTLRRRPDLMQRCEPADKERKILKEMSENKNTRVE
jgi:tRNA (guanine37-N1)-methyltransferase